MNMNLDNYNNLTNLDKTKILEIHELIKNICEKRDTYLNIDGNTLQDFIILNENTIQEIKNRNDYFINNSDDEVYKIYKKWLQININIDSIDKILKY